MTSTAPTSLGKDTASARTAVPAEPELGRYGRTLVTVGPFRLTYRTFALYMLLLVYIFNFIDRQIIAALQVPIMDELGLNYTQMGLLGGFSFALFYCVLGIPIARFADGADRVKVIAVALALWSLMTALCGIATGFLTLLLFRIGVGIGEAGCSPPAHSMISDLFPPHKRGTALGIYSLGIPIGGSFGTLFGGWLYDLVGWRWAFAICGLPGILVAVLVWFTMRDPPRGLSEGRAHPDTPGPKGRLSDFLAPSRLGQSFGPMLEAFPRLMGINAFRHVALGAATHSFVGYGLASAVIAFYIREFGPVDRGGSGLITVGDATLIGAFTGGILGAVGVYLGGRLGDLWGKNDARWYPWVCGLSQVIAFPLTIVAFLGDSLWWIVGFAALPAVLNAMYNAPNFAMAQALSDLKTRALSAAILLFVLNIIGLGLGPVVSGALTDALKAGAFLPAMDDADALRWTIIVMTAVNLWSAVHYWLAGRTIRADIAAARARDVAGSGRPGDPAAAVV